MTKKIGVIGAGGWGTAVALLLAKKGHKVTLWTRREEFCRHLEKYRENTVYLPGVFLPVGLELTSSLAQAVTGMDLVAFATPAKAVRQTAQAIRPHLAQETILVSLSKGNVRIEIVDKDERSIFPSGSSEPSPETVKILKEIAQSVTKLGNKVVIEGHTDATSYSTNRYTNWELSTDRASAARKILEDNGLNPDRIAMVAGYAATLPLIPENPNDPKNRRISITLLYNPATIPGR